ncbi:MFS transporter [Sphaerisporangium sp. NPDC049002]|uniref:MFS transporter n=1 Tax=unclassified Sphaerisporangium TaxID=2630420 RepID=UPI0033D4C5BB
MSAPHHAEGPSEGAGTASRTAAIAGASHVLPPRTAMRSYALISFLTWFPAGLTMASMILLMTSRGLDLAQVGMVLSVQAVVIVALELPTGGLADVLGRRVLLAVSALFSVAGLALLAVATSVWLFAVASVLKGIARALSSGPAQAWYVDMLHAARGPEADLKPGLARGEAMGSVSLCVATLTGGFMPLVLPGGLVTPMIAAAVAAAVLFVVVLVAMPEPPHPRPTIGFVLRDVAVTIGSGLRLGLRDRALGRLLLVSFAIGAGLYSIEVLTPGRLASLTGGAESASSVYALVASAGFAASGFGSWAAPWAARVLKGSVPAAVAGTVAGAGALGTLAATTVLTGVWGVAAAGAAYVVMFAAMGVAGLLRVEMMHRRVGSSQRATLMSVDSLQLQFGGMVSALGLGLLASRAGTAAAWWAAAAVVLVSALLYVRLPSAGTPPE